MAGVILLFSKNPKNGADLEDKIKRLKKYCQNNFKRYFKEISYLKPNNNHLLIQFRKNSESKIYSDIDGSWLTFSGHVFALNETRSYSANDLWNMYMQYKFNLPNYLDGHFVIKIFDAKQNKFIVFNDIYRNRIEFLTESEDYIMFSPFLLLSSVIKKPELDQFSFNEFMWRYYILSNRSMLKDSSKILPSTIYTIHNNKLSYDRYWQWPEKFTSMKFPDAVDKLCESMKESASLINKLEPNPLIEFTMGQDSRQIVSAFTNQKLPFVSAIYGKDSFYEVVNVKSVTKRHNIKNLHIKLSEDYEIDPWPHFKKGVVLGSAEEPGYLIGRIMHMKSQYLGLSNYILNGVHGRYYKDGLWNEIYVSNFYREPRGLDIDKLLKFRIMNKKYKHDIFNSEFIDIKSRSREYFSNMISHSIKGMEKSPISIQLDKFDAEHYGNFGNVANTACDFILNLISPLLLRRNLEFALELPVKWKYNLSRTQRAIVHKLDENLAREITDFANITMEPKSGLSYQKFLLKYWFTQSQKLRDKYKNRLGFEVKTQLHKAWDYLPIYKKMFENDEVKSLLNIENMVLSEILNENSWLSYYNDFTGRKDLTMESFEYLYKLLSVELFLQMCHGV